MPFTPKSGSESLDDTEREEVGVDSELASRVERVFVLERFAVVVVVVVVVEQIVAAGACQYKERAQEGRQREKRRECQNKKK